MRGPRSFQDDLSVPPGSNPEAGAHVVTADARELAAGREAAAITWNAFPYYERRYGDRGRLFCDSDTAWLITRCDAGRQVAMKDVVWLGDVLASRGMPRYLLEIHLGHLLEALLNVGAWQKSRFTPLHAARALLERLRSAQIHPEAFERMARAFDRAMSDEPGRVERFGAIVVAAVADERSGVVNAVPSLTSWACDRSIFSKRWIDEVERTVSETRAMRTED